MHSAWPMMRTVNSQDALLPYLALLWAWGSIHSARPICSCLPFYVALDPHARGFAEVFNSSVSASPRYFYQGSINGVTTVSGKAGKLTIEVWLKVYRFPGMKCSPRSFLPC